MQEIIQSKYLIQKYMFSLLQFTFISIFFFEKYQYSLVWSQLFALKPNFELTEFIICMEIVHHFNKKKLINALEMSGKWLW